MASHAKRRRLNLPPTEPSDDDSIDDSDKNSDDEDGHVCYGMLDDLKCQVLRGEVVPDARSLVDGNGNVALSLTLAEPRITIGLASHADFAQLNALAASALHQVAQMVKLEAYIDGASFRALDERAQQSTLARFRVQINIFGLERDGEQVGTLLSDYGLYLQEPYQLEGKGPYHNPHVWAFDDLPDVDIWLAGLSRGKLIGEQMTAEQGWNRVLDDLSSFDSGHTDLDTSCLTVPLLKHQVDALGFMTDREIGKLRDLMRYWRSGMDEDGILVYCHSVTAAERRERPGEPASGILADDMGLGKTLSTIALVTTSKHRAETFAATGNKEQMSHGTLTPTKSTLVVVPSLLILDEWKKEIEKHTIPRALRVVKHHGHDRVTTARELMSCDIVLTTYGTVANEHRRSYRGGREVLYFLRWFRIVLDEAHTIRSSRTAQCRAILALYANHHWCLTGTPVSNKVDDLAPLLRFCRVPLLQDPAVFRDHVAKITRKSFRQGCNVLRHALSPVCLRRTKALLNLPQPRAVDHSIAFSPAELERRADLVRYIRRCLDTSVSGSHNAKSKPTMLQAILQLRIFCNQGTFMPEMRDMEDETLLDPDEALTLLQEDGRATCASCSAEVFIINQECDLSSGTLGACSHVLCAICRGAAVDNTGGSEVYKCPQCEQGFAAKVLSYGQAPFDAPAPTKPHSAKLTRLIEDLLASNGKEKSIVFSTWKKTLDVAAQLCNDANIRHVRIDGTVPQALRQNALEDFTTKPDVSILLMTLGTGALGLNLTAATRVHILEPQWNPAVEKQAIGRVVRMGQEKHATIIRYSVKNSVEQQIQTYQRRKMQLVAAGFGDGANHAEYEAKILTATFFTEGAL